MINDELLKLDQISENVVGNIFNVFIQAPGLRNRGKTPQV